MEIEHLLTHEDKILMARASAISQASDKLILETLKELLHITITL